MSHVSGQEVSHIVWNPKFDCCVHHGPMGPVLRCMKWVHIIYFILFKIISKLSVDVCHDLDGSLFFTCVLSKIFYAWFMTLPLHFLFCGSIHSPVKLQGS
jgi:hypothetical protein